LHEKKKVEGEAYLRSVEEVAAASLEEQRWSLVLRSSKVEVQTEERRTALSGGILML